MYPGSHLASRADEPALIWAPTGTATTFAELDAAANRLSRLLRTLGVEPGDHVALCLENHPRYVGGVVGLPLRRGGIHGCVLPAHSRRARLHRRRLWRQGVHLVASSRRAGRGDPHHHPGSLVTVDARRHDSGLHLLRGQRRRPRPQPAGRSTGGDRHAVLLGHHRPSQGRLRRSRRRSPGDHGEQRHAAPAAAFSSAPRTTSTSPPPRCTTPPRCAS